jgi:hypothetical protein
MHLEIFRSIIARRKIHWHYLTPALILIEFDPKGFLTGDTDPETPMRDIIALS